MIIASFVSAMASSDRNISCSSKFLVQNSALFSGSLTAMLKCQTVPSCIFMSLPLRNASSALVPADDVIVTHAQAVRSWRGASVAVRSDRVLLAITYRIKGAVPLFDFLVAPELHRAATMTEKRRARSKEHQPQCNRDFCEVERGADR